MASSARPPLTAAAWTPLLREALAREGRSRLALRGTSMLPTLPVECEIEVAPLAPRTPIGSLVVFATGDTLVAHRLVRRSGERSVTQGDGRWVPDPLIGAEQLLGVAVAAYLGARRCWPGRAEPALRWFWVARYYLLRPLRFTWHLPHRLR
ncbi:MAG: S24/S26 family peptidase [Anaerolineae bacterium]|nr:S24/S26 family peptidase [Anaerolineae bacterium]